MNTGRLGGSVTVSKDNPSGYPAKGRGLWFDSDYYAYIPIDIILYHTFSVHFWVSQDTSHNHTLI